MIFRGLQIYCEINKYVFSSPIVFSQVPTTAATRNKIGQDSVVDPRLPEWYRVHRVSLEIQKIYNCIHHVACSLPEVINTK